MGLYDIKTESPYQYKSKYNAVKNLKKDLFLSGEEQFVLDAVIEGRLNLVIDCYNGLYQKLYEHFVNEMPYGTAKGRDGDPDQWIWDHLSYLDTLEVEE